MDGIFNVLKPPGMTSHDVVGAMRKILQMKKIGHAGTLDPMAAGVLPVFTGQERAFWNMRPMTARPTERS